MTEENVNFIAAIARPGDTVLIGFEQELTEDDVEELDEAFEPLRSTGVQIGFTDGVSSMVVIRPGDESDFDKEFPNG